MGSHVASIQVTLVDYPDVPPLQIDVKLTISHVTNNLPYFSPKIASAAAVQKTATIEPWTFTLPKIMDDDKD